MTLTKAKLIEAISEKNDYSKNRSAQIVETMLEIIKSNLVSEEDVLISGFGKFCVKNKQGRKGRNPATGKGMMLAPRRVVTFKYSGMLRNKINE